MNLIARPLIVSSVQGIPRGLAAMVIGVGMVFPTVSALSGSASAADAPAQNQPVNDARHPYISTGLLAVKPGDGIAMEIEQQTQARLLVHPGLFSYVLQSSDPIRQTQWFKQFVVNHDGKNAPDIAAAKADLLAHFEVTVVPKSRLIQVRMSTADPNDSQTIVREIVDGYIKEMRESQNLNNIERAQALEQLKLNHESQIRDINGRMLRIAVDLGTLGVGIGEVPDSKEYELQQLITEQLKLLMIAGEAGTALKRFDEQMKTNSAPQLLDAAQKDPVSMLYRNRLARIEDIVADAEATAGAKDPKTVAAKRRLEMMKQKLDDAENDVKSRTAEEIRDKLQDNYSSAESALKRIDERINEIRSEISSLAKMKNEYAHLQGDLTDLRAKLAKEIDEQDRLGYLSAGVRIPISWAAQPDLPDVNIAQ